MISGEFKEIDIKIPYSHLNSDNIKIEICGINIKLKYVKKNDIVVSDSNNASSFSLQGEIRKFKEIDEKLIQKFL